METIHHKLQQFDPGIVWLDKNNRILAMNGVAAETFGAQSSELVGQGILQLHPEQSREKVAFLLAQSSCPEDSPPPMTMMINIPERVLLVKVAKMFGETDFIGTCMVYYDLTDITMARTGTDETVQDTPGRLYKLPVYKDRRILLIDLNQVRSIKADGHYSSLYTGDDTYLCNLSLSDLEKRLDKADFVRVHRSYLVNLRSAMAFEKIDEHCHLVIEGKEQIRVPISRNKVSKIKSLLGIS
ncbi:MAG: LytTR family transcriptional regulator DNA-binding domain-containing protein [Proteobacteria bacterium]|nr:LytTR family transcriptional regulator DNA-binding domain-containing protein [Pseudomonadota bacterium]